ncbi:MAG TPA: redoxin domain-containing protein [Chloroflexota bacterium]|nr:redoxin domain-containing protein [Chloroflexota bacterium]
MNVRRFGELEERFAALAAELPESPEKEALSVLHGMIQELRRAQAAAAAPAGGGPTFQDIANLYKTAPKMDGEAVSEPLAVGTKAPDFSLRDANNELVSLSDFRGRPVVLVFYPLDWSPTCSDQLSLYQAELPELERFGAQVVGISPDSIYSHGAWAAVRGITFPLLADFEPKGAVSRLYNVWRTGDGFPERALYVVDGNGIIRYAHVSPRLSHIPDIYDLYRALSEITGVPAPTSSAQQSVGVNGHAGH